MHPTPRPPYVPRVGHFSAYEVTGPIKTQTVLPSAETAAMLFWALLASGQITMRKVNGWQTLGKSLAAPVPVDHAA